MSSAMQRTMAESPALEAQAAERTRELGLWDAVSIIVGVVIGAGIYETAPLVMANASSPGQALAFWIAGGLLSLVGATCYAELASTYPRSGGDYVYLSRAFGPFVGFMFGWAQLAVILTASIGMMAYVFADYATSLWGVDGATATLLAAGAVSALSALNLAGVVVGKATQNVLSLLKLLGLGCIVIAGFWAGQARAPAAEQAAVGSSASLGLAMILVLYTFGGWNDAAFVAAEVRNRKKNLPRALLFGTAIITLVYVSVNAAFIAGLGFERARRSNAIAAELLEGAIGPEGALAIAILVMISALGAANALIFTGTRVYSSMGEDFSALSALKRWNPRVGAPVGALAVQLAIALSMILGVGTQAGRAVIDAGIAGVGLGRVSWSGHGGFDTLLSATAPVFWFFFLLTGLSLFALRRIDKGRPRPFSVPLYPVLPMLFCATAAFMLLSAVQHAGALTLLGAVPVLAGLPFYLASKRRPSRADVHERLS